MAQTDRNSATTTPPSPPPQLQEAIDAAQAAQAAAEVAQAAAEAAVADVGTAISDQAVTKSSNTGSADIPAGTSAERDVAPEFGWQRANTTLNRMEWWNGIAWVPMGGGATGGSTNAVFFLNDQTVTTDYAIPAGQNAMSAGPITVAGGVTVTIPSGSTWTVV